MRAFLLAAGHGVRFQPVTASIPKPLFPFLNVALIRAHLARLQRQGVSEAGVNLHHLGEQIESELRDRPTDLPKLHFFREPTILGTAGGLRNASDWLAGGDFLVLNTDAAIAPDVAGLFARHRASGRAATLLVVDNRDPHRYTPLEAEGDRIVGFGGHPERPLLYTGVCVLSPRVLPLIPPGERSLVADLWRPLLEAEPDPIGWVLHEGPFSDLGIPRDFLRASLEALERSGPFPDGAGRFDPETGVLSQLRPDRLDIRSSVVGDARIDVTARIRRSVVWSGVSIGREARLTDCLVAGGRVPDGAIVSDRLLWPGEAGIAAAHPLSVS